MGEREDAVKSVTIKQLAGHTYAFEMDNGRQKVTIDEPPASGGDDLGPSPVEMLLGALGGCTAITLVMYAKRKGWALEDLTVTVSQEDVDPSQHPAFTPEEAARSGSGLAELYHMNVYVKGDLDAEQLRRLNDIAGRCPVHRTLESKPKITHDLVRVD